VAAIPAAAQVTGTATDDTRTRRLVARARHGDRDPKRGIVVQHMGVVGAVARRYRDVRLPKRI
jgi:hypothetical protein